MPRKIEISHKTIVFSVLLILSLGLLYFLRDLILQLFVGLLLMAILEPMVATLSRFRVPRVVSVLITYVLVIGLLAGIIAIIMPTVIDQTGSFINTFPGYLENVGITPSIGSDIIKGFTNNIGTAPGAIFQFTFSLVNNVIEILTVLIFAFYMLISRDKLESQLGLFFGEERQKDIGRTIDILEKKMGGWARAELALMIAIGVTTYFGLWILGIPFALPLAILGGLLEVIPFLGPIVAAVPSVLIGFGISPITGVGVAVLTFLIHEVEGYVLIPKIMEKSVGVSPLVTLISLAIGARLAGIVGMIISVPVVITIQVLAKRYLIRD